MAMERLVGRWPDLQCQGAHELDDADAVILALEVERHEGATARDQLGH